MSLDNKAVSEILDKMALKILLVEPGDLSVVGELLGAAEELLGSGELTADFPVLHRMAGAFKDAVERMIMGEFPDSAENYDLLGRAIIQMQELVRKGEDHDEEEIAAFIKYLNDAGYSLTPDQLLGGPAESGSAAAPAEPVAPGEASGSQIPALVSAAPAPGGEEGGGVADFLQDKELLGGFVEEAFEHLESIEVNVLELEQKPNDQEIINNIFRPFHTIKGVSGFLNLKTINKLAHATENLLDDVRNGKRQMDSDIIDLVLAVGDTLRELVGNIKEVLANGPSRYREFDISAQVAYIQALQRGESPDAVSLPASGTDAESEAEPVVSLLEVDTPAAATPPSPLSAFETGGRVVAAAAPRKKMGAAIKVDVEKLDALVNAVGELVIMQSLLRQNQLITRIADPKFIKDFSQLGRITSELQRTAMSMRMVPIKQTFDKMIRLVRDLSKKTGKEVDLVMEGAETEIDRNMVDSIYDPLVHMMRNSVDHGIQSPEERIMHGKPPTGMVHLRAYQKGGNMVIEIEDDGEGLPADKIRSKAESRGLIKPGEKLSDFELYNLIFLPGFSTADQITDVSGRGVGMDVVKKGVEKLRGKVEVQSQTGKGSLFVIRLPLTLAIIDGIIVRVGSERYIIPTIAIQESVRPERQNYNTVHGRGESLMTRGELVPIIRLYRLFGVEPSQSDPCEAIMVVVENEGRRRALMVDELLGKEEVVIKNLGGMQDVAGVAGGTILGDGRVGLILDLAGIITQASE